MRQRIIDRLQEASRLSEFDAGRWRDLKDAPRRHRHFDDRRVLPVAAARVSARSRRRSGLRARRRHRSPAARRRVARPRRFASAAASRATTTTWRWCSRSSASAGCAAALRALLDRRLVAPQASCADFCEAGPRDLTAASRAGARPAASRDVLSGVRDGLRRVPRTTARSAIRSSRCSRGRDIRQLAIRRSGGSTASSRHTRGPGGVPRAHRSAARVLPDAGRASRAAKASRAPGSRADDCDTEDAWKRHRQAAAAIAPAVAEAIRAFRRDLNVVMSRGVWRIFAVALEQYQRTLEAHALLDFSGVLERAVKLLKDMDEFAREPPPARSALPARARRRVPGHEPRAVGAGRAARAELGRRPRRRRRRDPAVDLHRRRPQAVDLRVPRRRRRGARRSRGVHRGAAARTASRGRRSRSAFDRRRRFWRSSTTCSRPLRARRRSTARRVPLRRPRSVSGPSMSRRRHRRRTGSHPTLGH